jgi:hypothetical protein
MFLPFLVPVALRRLPCLDFLMWMGERLATMGPSA